MHRSAARFQNPEARLFDPEGGGLGQSVYDDDGEPPAGRQQGPGGRETSRPGEEGFEHGGAGLGGQVRQHVVEGPPFASVGEKAEADLGGRPRFTALPRGRIDPFHGIAKLVLETVSFRESRSQTVPVAKHDLGSREGLREGEPDDADAAARIEHPARLGQDRIASHGLQKESRPHIDVEGGKKRM